MDSRKRHVLCRVYFVFKRIWKWKKYGAKFWTKSRSVKLQESAYNAEISKLVINIILTEERLSGA